MKLNVAENMEMPSEIEEAINDLEKKLNAQYPLGVPRNKIGEATGGLMHPRTCANEDSLGHGISGRFKVGRNTVYPPRGIIAKLRSKISVAA